LPKIKLRRTPLPKTGVHIAILKGDHGVNVLKTKTAVTPVVEVRDANDQPVPGVSVTFTSPNDGPSVTFMNGSRSITVTTDPGGQASAIGLKPVNQGRFQIAVSASQETQTVMTAIAMSNVATSVTLLAVPAHRSPVFRKASSLPSSAQPPRRRSEWESGLGERQQQ